MHGCVHVCAFDPLGTRRSPRSASAVLHHATAINALAFGRKRWLLRPPTHAAWSPQPAFEYAASVEEERRHNNGSAHEVLSCVQEAGDVLVLPEHWAHATVNEEVSVGVALEFYEPHQGGGERVESGGKDRS